MYNTFSKYELLSSIASRKRKMDQISVVIEEFEKKIKKLNKEKDELRNLNSLDEILLKEIK